MSVLISYDGSPSAKVAVVSAAATLDQAVFPRHDVTLLHVWNGPMAATDSFNYKEDPDAPSTERLVEASERRAQETIEEGRRLAMDYGLMPDTLIVRNESSVPATILRVAEEQGSSLIVLGAHPHGTPGPTLDSVSAAVIAGSTRPVLVIPMSTAGEASLVARAHHDAVGKQAPHSLETAWGAIRI
jgi:nucleotide-binding universal stress UspA family protein